MKYLTILSFVLFIACSQKNIPIATDNDETITVQKGDNFGVLLSSMPGTGYTWELRDAPDTRLIKFLKKEHRSAQNGEIAPGNDYFSFETLEKGSTTLIFWYIRKWEKNDPTDANIQTKKYRVEIK